MRVLHFFDFYTIKFGWEIIPVLPNSKIPFMRGWNKEYDRNKIRSYLEKHPDCNIGLLLGNIVDIEADTPKSNDLLNRLVMGYYHPMYKSEKSIHHLFVTPDPNLTRIIIHGIEFRGRLHQSVLPPSVNNNGAEYIWIEEPIGPLPPLPPPLVNLYNKHNKMMLGAKAKNAVEPLCSVCGRPNRPIHWKRYRLEVKAFETLNRKWQCHKCRTVDIRQICREMRFSGVSNYYN